MDMTTPLAVRLADLSKAQLVEIYRNLNSGKVGDTARTSKDEYLRMVLSFPEETVLGITVSLYGEPVTEDPLPEPQSLQQVQQLIAALHALLPRPASEEQISKAIEAAIAPLAERIETQGQRIAYMEGQIVRFEQQASAQRKALTALLS